MCTSSASLNFTLYEEEEELVSLSAHRRLEIKYSKECLEKFWMSIKIEYRKISEKALKIFVAISHFIPL